MKHLALAAVLVLSCSLAGSPTAWADVWKKVDEHGGLHYTDRPTGKGWKLILRSKRRSPARGSTWKQLEKNRARFGPLIEKTAGEHGLDANLIHAVVRAESAYDAGAESNKGAVGLMQLMPATARRYGVGDRRDPAQNVSGGVRYLRDLLRQFRNVALALAAYNAGENAVVRHGNKIPPYPETEAYVKKVIRFYQELGKAS